MTLLTNLSHTPGWHYAVAYLLGALVFLAVTPRRFDRGSFWAVYISFAAVVTLFMIVTDERPQIFFLLFMAVILLLLYSLIRTECRINRAGAAYICIRAFILGELAANLEWRLFYFVVRSFGVPPTVYASAIVMAVTYLGVFSLAYGLERQYIEHNSGLRLSFRDAFTAIIIGLSVFALSNLSYAHLVTPFSGRYDEEIFNIRFLMDLGGVGILFAYHMQLCELYTRSENEALQNMLHMQHENYLRSEESIELVNRKYHDLKHQLNVLRSELTTGEKLEALDEIYDEIKAYEAQNKTGNRVLDTILAAKTLQCQSEGITLTSVAEGEALGFMDAVDISALFGNALDNAIESVRKISEPDRRLIHLSVSKSRGFLRIKIENCYNGEVQLENGMPRTTKSDQRNHGYGMKSIKNIAEKYSGSLIVKPENGWFELSILFPIKKSADA